MGTYRRKPTPPIEAVQFTGDLTREMADFLQDWSEGPARNGYHCWDEPSMTLKLWNAEERQHITVPTGHWVIKGIRGEYYPCSEEVFQASYEAASEIAADMDVAEARVIPADADA